MQAMATEQAPSEPMRVVVGIATRGRPAVLRETLIELDRQTRSPDRIIVCHTCEADVGGAVSAFPGAEFVEAPSGLPRQRNRILDTATDCDIVVFLDDDFLAAPDYVAATVAAFVADPAIVVTTGTPIADDVKGPGLAPQEGRRLIAADARTRQPVAGDGIVDASHGYGCNMAIRLFAARRHGERFDERLPLYGWSEDVDYTHRLARHGRVVKLAHARGVHLGVKHGRSPGRNLGYSQIANPIYLHRKGSYTLGRAWRSLARNLLANCLRSVRPEPYIDRRGRLHGNLLAFADWMRGRMAPERILDL